MARLAATGPMKATAARQMRRTAQLLDDDHPEMITGGHLRDAARVLEHGSTEGAKRHLDAAMELLTPRNLIRHGIRDDEGHALAKHHMHQVHRHRLAVQDIEDIAGRNDRLRDIARAARGQPAIGENLVPAAAQLARTGRPAVELAFWDRELRAPSGEWMDAGSSAAVSMHGMLAHGVTPRGEQVHGYYNHGARTVTGQGGGKFPVRYVRPSASKGPKVNFGGPGQLAATFTGDSPAAEKDGTMPGVITLVGPKGYVHGWHFVGKPGSPESYKSLLAHPDLAKMNEHDRAVTASHLTTAMHKASSGDHTMAEAHLKDARRRAVSTGSTGLTRAITVQHAYHRREATRGIPGQRLSTKASYEKFIRKQQQRPRPVPRQVYRQPSVPFALSNRTAMLERTPAPRGRPGGPGLYDVAGMGHTAYLQQIVKALIEKRGMAPDKAYAVARGAIRKWMRGGGHVHPEVRAAAGRAEAGEDARQARAHSHVVTSWEQADALVELATTIDLFNPYHAPTGQFTTASGAGQGQGKQQDKRHDRKQRVVLLRKAAGIRAQIRALEAQLPSSSRGPGRAAASKTRSSAPAKKGAGATSAAQAKAGKTAAAGAASTTARAATTARSAATVHAKIIALRGQLQAVLAQLRHL